MDTSDKASKSLRFSDPEATAKFHELKTDGKNNGEFFKELLECYEKFTGKSCSTVSEEFFKNIVGTGKTIEEKAEHKKEKESALRKMFELESNDPLMMSEYDLLEKASRCSGKTITEMSLEGRVLVAKNEIGRHIQYELGKGTKGSGDDKILQTYDFMKHSNQKLSLNRLTQLSGSNRKTVESWCERNNITFE